VKAAEHHERFGAEIEITEDQYREFYKHVAHDSEAPLAWSHNRVEGRQEYVQLLYIRRARPSTCGTGTSAAA